jgi:hypothetical protein
MDVEPLSLEAGKAGWTARDIHQAVLTTFEIADSAYGLNQSATICENSKRHGLLERDGARYAYRSIIVWNLRRTSSVGTKFVAQEH